MWIGISAAAMALDESEGSIPTAVSVLLLAIDPTLNETQGWSPDVASHLALNTIIPFTFDGDDALRLRLDGDDVTDQINMTQGFQLSEGDSESTVATLFGRGAAVTIRIFYADSCGEEVPFSTSTLQGEIGDQGGIDYNAIRLETVLFDSADDSQDVREVCKENGFLKIGLIVAAKESSSESDAVALESYIEEATTRVVLNDDGSTAVDVQVGNLHFELSRNMTGVSEAMQGAINYRKINGIDVKPVASSAFIVNGEEVAKLHVL